MEMKTEDALPFDQRVANCVNVALCGLSTARNAILAMRSIYSAELPRHEKGLVVPNDALPAYVNIHWFLTDLDLISEMLGQMLGEGIAKQETEPKE